MDFYKIYSDIITWPEYIMAVETEKSKLDFDDIRKFVQYFIF